MGLLVIVTLMLAACQSNPKSAVMYRGGAQRTGLYDTQSVPELDGVKWKFETGGEVWPSPVVADGVVYVGSDDDHLYAVDTGTGEGIWKFQTGDDVHSSPAIADGVVYFGSWDHTVYAVDAQTGQEIWKFYTLKNMKPADVRRPLYDDFSSSPLVVDGVVYVGGVDGSACFYAIDAQTGDEMWSFTPMMGDFVVSSPALLDDTVYFGGSEGLYALDIQTGEEEWLFETEGAAQSPAIGDDGLIYFGSKDPALYAVDAQSGELRWRNDELVDPANWTWNMSPSTTIADGLVYAAVADTTIAGASRFFFAVGADSGEVVWSFPYSGNDWSSMSAAGGVVYFGGGISKNVYAVDAQTGEELWRFTTEGAVHSTPVVDNGVVYVGSLDGYLYALN